MVEHLEESRSLLVSGDFFVKLSPEPFLILPPGFENCVLELIELDPAVACSGTSEITALVRERSAHGSVRSLCLQNAGATEPGPCRARAACQRATRQSLRAQGAGRTIHVHVVDDLCDKLFHRVILGGLQAVAYFIGRGWRQQDAQSLYSPHLQQEGLDLVLVLRDAAPSPPFCKVCLRQRASARSRAGQYRRAMRHGDYGGY